jgi:GntR family transcriptional regulator / MocR family aminotransferase
LFICALIKLGAMKPELRSNLMLETQTNPAPGTKVQGVHVGLDARLAWGALLDLSATRPGPLHMRLAAAIRTAIRNTRLPLGAALPPSRTLAGDLGISRWTVTQAYAQLITEGYLTGKTGSATRVSWTPGPDGDPTAPAAGRAQTAPVAEARIDMYSCGPDLRAFPRRKWVAAIRAATETAPFEQLDYSATGGLPQLRGIIAEHLNRSRGAAAEPATVSIFSGSGQALTQLGRALLAEGYAAIGLENPGSIRLRQAAETAGLHLVPLPVDNDGLVVAALDDYPDLRVVCVGAARQVGYGCPLAQHRRKALLDWARRAGGLVIEDDYESEFSYDRPAPPVMQGVDPHRVALLGSMSMAIGPSVNIGWTVVPHRWVAAVRAEHEIQLLPPSLNQLALVQLMQSGDYDRHLRATRSQYRARRNVLADALRRYLPDFHVLGAQSGLQVLLELPPRLDPAAIVAAAARRGLAIGSLDEMRFAPDQSRPGLMLAFGSLKDSSIDEAVMLLADVLQQAG